LPRGTRPAISSFQRNRSSRDQTGLLLTGGLLAKEDTGHRCLAEPCVLFCFVKVVRIFSSPLKEAPYESKLSVHRIGLGVAVLFWCCATIVGLGLAWSSIEQIINIVEPQATEETTTTAEIERRPPTPVEHHTADLLAGATVPERDLIDLAAGSAAYHSGRPGAKSNPRAMSRAMWLPSGFTMPRRTSSLQPTPPQLCHAARVLVDRKGILDPGG